MFRDEEVSEECPSPLTLDRKADPLPLFKIEREISRSGVYSEAVASLREIENIWSPMKKLRCIKKTCDEICIAVKAQYPDKKPGELAISADDLLPLLSYVLIHAAPPHFESWMHMIEHFMPESMERGRVMV